MPELDQILRLPLAPLLLLQGIWVRSRALALPEAAGLRAGREGTGNQLRILIAGDSSAAGVGARHQSEALSGQLSAHLSRQFDVIWHLEAATGHRTRDTLGRLGQLPRQHFDIVILALGVNDVTGGTTRRQFKQQQSRLMELLHQRFTPNLILVSGVPQMHRFPALPQPLAWVLGQQSARLDRVLSDLSARNPCMVHLPFDLPLNPDLVAADGYHPSPAAYRLWAERLASEIQSHHALPPSPDSSFSPVS